MNAMLTAAEKMALSMGALFESSGYQLYQMSKFEEYDLYAKNKDFLVSDSVITFTDTNGKLMALKPDVTLSIVKNGKDLPWVQKVYYKENVYRVSRGVNGYREIMQLGLEAMGQIDDYCVTEVMELAIRSLEAISPNAVLEVSHLGILKEVTDSLGIPFACREKLVKLISEKNPHELARLCRDCGIGEEAIGLLQWMATASGSASVMLPQMKEKLSGLVREETLSCFEGVLRALDSSCLRVDFSVVDDIHYYNGFVFRGFVAGIPDSVLSGGQYDKLMKKMNRTAGAIGFAVYTDRLQRLEEDSSDYDVDVLVLYDRDTDLAALRKQVKDYQAQNLSVMVQQVKPEDIRYRQLVKINGSEVETLENDA